MTVWAVADANLLLPSSSRRLLLGLAASRGERVGVTRTVVDELHAKLPKYMQNARERASAKIAFARDLASVPAWRTARRTEASLHEATG